MLIPLILCIEAPLEVFSSNYDELLFSLGDFFPMLIFIAVIIALCIGAFLFALPKRLYNVFYMLFIATALLLFAQENYLNAGISSLAGDNLGAEELSKGAVIGNLIIWCVVEAVALAAGLLIKKIDWIGSVATVLAIVILGTQLVGTVTVSLTESRIFLTKAEYNRQLNPEYSEKYVVFDKLTDMASDGNIYYFCIDRFDETYAEDAYSRKPELFEALDGFTWFKDDIAYYAHTFPSIANMLTDAEYDSSEGREQYLNESYNADTPLSALNAAGYGIRLYTDPFYAYSEAYYLPDYVESVHDYSGEEIKLDVSTSFHLCVLMVKMALYRCSFILGKTLFDGLNTSEFNACINTSVNINKYNMNNKAVFDYVADTGFNISGGRQFSFIHIDGCHEVEYDDSWCAITEEEQKDIYYSVVNSMKIVYSFIDALKAAGKYEDATIIITGDHASAINDFTPLEGTRQTALFYKPSGSSGTSLAQSDKQVAHKNIWATVFKEIGVECKYSEGTSLFEVPDGNVKRTYVWHTWDSAGKQCDEYTYEINGPGNDFSSWKIVDQKHYDRFLCD